MFIQSILWLQVIFTLTIRPVTIFLAHIFVEPFLYNLEQRLESLEKHKKHQRSKQPDVINEETVVGLAFTVCVLATIYCAPPNLSSKL